MSDSIKCPYCGEEMKFCDDGYDMSWYCPKCLAEAPAAHSEEAAYAAAMKRHRVKGEWGKPVWGRDYLDRPIIIASECSICHKKSEFQTHFCPNCGADMRMEAKDEQ